MCGISGCMRFTAPVSADDYQHQLKQTEGIRHRGPDTFQVRKVGPRILLGSARLRITDPANEAADMPMTSPDGVATVTFNGQIYNHFALRRELSDYPFRTRSDTETLLAAYLRWGPDMLTRLDGMFSFAIYDSRNNALFLAVDPTGQKPLYYSVSDRLFSFNSEIHQLIRDPRFGHSFNIAGIAESITQRFIIGEDTHIDTIKKLDAGCQLLVHSSSVKQRRYYIVPVQEQATSEREAPRMLEHALRESILRTSSLEVPGAVFLSGGLDSSAVFSGLSQVHPGIDTYTVGFEEIENAPTFSDSIVANEFSYTSRLAAEFGSRNHRYTLDAATFFAAWDDWITRMGEPLCFNETAAHLHLFKQASRSARVVFCGSGADELFDGYGFGAQLEQQGVLPGSVAAAYHDDFSYGFGCDMSRLVALSSIRSAVITKLQRYLSPYLEQTRSVLQLVQLLMLHARLPHSEFRQIDTASMASSVEARLPFANASFIKQAFSFDPSLKHREGISKHVLRQAMQPLIPDYIYSRPKVPFAPIGQLFYTKEFSERLTELFSPDAILPELGIVNMRFVQYMIDSGKPMYRPVLSRLVTINRVLTQQSPFMTNYRRNAEYAKCA